MRQRRAVRPIHFPRAAEFALAEFRTSPPEVSGGGVDSNAWSVAQGCAEEAIAVAKASNVRLNVGDPIEHIRKLGGKIPDAPPSMLLDYNAGGRCEVDAINGAIPRLGKPLGIATPVNETVVGIIRARERRMLASARK
jgi:2-dehydropantoate 2-reductase